MYEKYIKTMKKPSEIQTPEIKFGCIPPKGYLAITWFGKMYINKKNKEYWEKYPDYFKNITVKHEKIHIMQAEKTRNSWFCFYCKYIWFWLKAMFLCKFKNSIAYYCNPFEVEAYMHEKQKYYSCNEYDFYQKIPIAVYVSIYKSAKNFSDFLMHILEYKLTNKELK